MASHRRPKQPSRTRVTVLTATAAAAVALTSQGAAQAAPKPSKDEVKSKVDKLYEDAERATDKYNGAKEKQQKLEKQIDALQDKVADGQEELNDLRDGLGSMASAQYRSGGIDPSLQLFLSSDPDDYLDKASTLDQLSSQQVDELKKIQKKQRDLAQKRKEAAGKLDDLADTREELGKKKKEVQGKLGEAQKLLNTLTAKEKSELAAKEQKRASRAADQRADLGDEAPASGRGAAALSAAATQIGKPYVSGGTGPNSYDCSGLTQWAFAQAASPSPAPPTPSRTTARGSAAAS
ncbi:NlpC/P60 domain-containing protein OS=Streptomyces alboniger OX=132473 GN=CP975_09400 PE=3 SV=1 [Streptomyces alboniger]